MSWIQVCIGCLVIGTGVMPIRIKPLKLIGIVLSCGRAKLYSRKVNDELSLFVR
jgi:hypothetical protein